MIQRALAARRGSSRRRSLPKPPRPVYPESLVRTYQRQLLEISNMIYAEVKNIIFPQLEALVLEARRYQQDHRLDDYAASIDRMMHSLNITIDPKAGAFSEAMAIDIGQKVSKWNDAQWQRTLRKVLGVSIFQHEPWLADRLNGFVRQNVELIKSLQSEALRDVEMMVHNGIQSGVRHEVIMRNIKGKFSDQIAQKLRKEGKPITGRTIRTRARLIARDQVSKLNGDLTRIRQTEAGIKKYTWHDSGDRRVRDSHRARDGNDYSWTDPEHGGGHPGMEIQCRCTAEPVFDEKVYQKYAGRAA